MEKNDVSNAVKLLNEMYEVLQNEAKKGFETPNEHVTNYDNQIAILRVIRLLNNELLSQSEQLKCGNQNPPCAPNSKFGMLECCHCDWSE